MDLTVNQKGVIGLVRVMADLVTRRYEVFTPTSDASPVDLILANSTMSLRRLQVKYRELHQRPRMRADTKVLTVDLASIVNGKRIPIDRSKIDGLGIYCPYSDQVYYVRTDEVSGVMIRICLSDFPGRKNRLASEFLDPERLWTTGN
jgi:hypothetical protein